MDDSSHPPAAPAILIDRADTATHHPRRASLSRHPSATTSAQAASSSKRPSTTLRSPLPPPSIALTEAVIRPATAPPQPQHPSTNNTIPIRLRSTLAASPPFSSAAAAATASAADIRPPNQYGSAPGHPSGPLMDQSNASERSIPPARAAGPGASKLGNGDGGAKSFRAQSAATGSVAVDQPPWKQVGLGLTVEDAAAAERARRGSGESSGQPGPAAARAREMLESLGLENLGEAEDKSPGGQAHGLRTSTSRETLPRLATAPPPASSHTMGATSPVSTTSPQSYAYAYSPPPSLATFARQPSPRPSPSPSASMPLPLPSSTPTSSPMFRGPSTASSSGSFSRNGDIHVRIQSLTSAFPPVTASPSPSPSPNANTGLGGLSTPIPIQRGWKSVDPHAPTSTPPPSSPRRKSSLLPPARPSSSALSALLGLPSALVAVFLAPLAGAGPATPAMNGSTAPTTKGRRWPLLVRLATLAYLAFACVWFSANVGGRAFGSAGGLKGGLGGIRLGTRGDGDGLGGEELGYGRAAVGRWAMKVKEGVRWRAGRQVDEEVVEQGLESEALSEEHEEEEASAKDDGRWGTVKRIGGVGAPEGSLLTSFSHTYRFAKMHDKLPWDAHSEIEPYVFRATATPSPKDISACLYTNAAWLSTLPAFVHAWEGPVSLVFEAAHSRTSPERQALLDTLAALRDSDALVREFVDFHIVGAPASTGARALNQMRQRMLERPVALNFHANLARFFAHTDIIFLVGDARITPSAGLRHRLISKSLRSLVLERGDAIVVPNFAFVRDPTGGTTTPSIPSLHALRAQIGLPATVGQWDGVSADEFDTLAAAHVAALHDTLPLTRVQWPQKKMALVRLVDTRVPTPEAPTPAKVALFDSRWDTNHGPTNWYLWRKAPTDLHLAERPEVGGGIGLGVDGRLGGGNEVYRVVDYDLHYAPNVVVSRKGQPWCTERFDDLRAACVYQMFLSGAEMWVLPDEWTYTLEVVEKSPEGTAVDPAEKLKRSISARLYGKFHQEACMHYGREFLSVQMWDSDKAQHLRMVCARTLGTWGMGDSS